jgi:hypothetical protein
MNGSGRPSSTQGTSHGNKTKDIRDAVKAELDFDRSSTPRISPSKKHEW